MLQGAAMPERPVLDFAELRSGDAVGRIAGAENRGITLGQLKRLWSFVSKHAVDGVLRGWYAFL